ncbi:MAG: diaminopimelate decarboxylase [Desulfobulbaceae bacterium]|uniref:Diaminopimelate decarboxylase n=1 Tax=Candidatus Desulfobia pelagia TaxID=2841692 RepID=A0A8J6NE72_9BACT|nr:diaminopimelate decarboxylase [Candidatus Desulfobia pelagia]
MHHFEYKNKELYCESVPVRDIAAEVGTPFYLYSTATLTRHFKAFDEAFAMPHVTCFATKACSNIAILNLFAGLGGGADIVSGGELFRALKAGVDPRKIVYSGVGKSVEELRFGLESGILMFNIESVQELHALQKVAEDMGVSAPVSFRVNPDVDPKTHAYISTGLAKNKFGIPIQDALDVYVTAQKMQYIEVIGVSCHIGSQLTQISPFVESLQKVKIFIGRLAKAGIHISHLDLGGGLGIRYDSEDPPLPAAYAEAIKDEMEGLDCTLILEPGRVIVGNAGILVTKVLYTKQGGKKFVIVDAGMNDLARPSLYGAYHGIQPVVETEEGNEIADVVGPICETGDFLARGQEVPITQSGDLLAVMSSGAYGFSMASNYNSRPRVPEVLVDGDQFYVIRKRETYEDLIAGETIPSS